MQYTIISIAREQDNFPFLFYLIILYSEEVTMSRYLRKIEGEKWFNFVLSLNGGFCRVAHTIGCGLDSTYGIHQYIWC